jgi:uncharacterized protein with ACT and thioredoxin-like domain
MPGSVLEAADLVVSEPVQCGVMAVMAVSDSALFDIARLSPSLGREGTFSAPWSGMKR